ncbi:MAG: Tfp pilus assembly protein, ATPase PilM [Candidatus Falkowbacteria bacterium GW2011_GWA2_39_24]|uniref:Tfp pilus assembly protein, ATPase PilM n=1 Tax=Candidatus Falkowbacteria bacterium GW2011_GWA2_39_24 TaxID=1618634 RepID=A0A0G0NGL8_9BACT|nr:MAG: Tfp pilus assembly protein, ATPase PilM [Candidatus Falkowbacteria bacterium GW2011_GWA2_39_24]
MSLFSTTPVSYLGVDIGSSSIKVVELKKHQDKVVLVNYGYSEQLTNAYPNGAKLDIKRVAEAIEKITKKTGMSARDVVSSLPTFTVFSSIIHLSGRLTAKDLDSAIAWEAKKIIPLPLKDIVLDWQRIDEGGPGLLKNRLTDKDEIKQAEIKLAQTSEIANTVPVAEKTEVKAETKAEKKETKLAGSLHHKVLLIGAPKSLIKSYAYSFKSIKFNLVNLETEVFGLIRSLLGNDRSTVMIVQLGANSTNVFIVNKGVPMLSRSIDVGGLAITKAISKNLNISLEKAEQFKYDLTNQEGPLPKMITEVIAPVFNEVKYILEGFSNKEQLEVSKVILTGGGSMLGGLAEYFSDSLNKNVLIGDPWFRVAYPLELKPVLEQIGPRLAVAIGLAMREFDKS